MSKPRIFIGSSVESLPIADAIAENLEFDAEVTIWRSGTFNLSSNTLDDLILKSKSVDFSAFIFSPDDLAIMRSREKYVVRDNVLFELGLFIGSIGKERCFIIKPRGEELHFPSDLLGITPTDYDQNRSDNNLTSSLTYASTQIKREMSNKGVLKVISTPEFQKLDVNNVLSEVSEKDLIILGSLLESYNNDIEGCVSWLLPDKIPLQIPTPTLNLSIVKLQRVGLIEKSNSSDFNGNEFFTYRLTDYGVDICLKYEEKISKLFSSKPDPGFGPQTQKF
ncbi:TIR domain-containing protein [Pseudoalteromonas maricaloris]|uniref:Nucleotide-binding protein n=1 Tax=Pseudoalteromonas maricaloris TaxID=184924 RepID=A0A8I2H4R8_9GAMM|nr:nucleotide-binding protein [Pseudoalteromonas maricaloris]NLR22165.1 nucleotide-binding protein [Pseudoalteromonas maricaloris]WOX31472.1 nucleotide-binding protein [Pseudoalteromonas maricaloris]